MEYYFQCKLCGEKFYVNPYCPCVFGDHLLEKHPELQLSFFSSEPKDKQRNNCHCCSCIDYRRKKRSILGLNTYFTSYIHSQTRVSYIK